MCLCCQADVQCVLQLMMTLLSVMENVLGTECSRNLYKITIASSLKPMQFPSKIYFDEFFCGKITGQPTTLPKLNSFTCIFQEFCLYFKSTFFQLSMVASERIQNKRVISEKLISIAHNIGAQRSSILAKFLACSI